MNNEIVDTIKDTFKGPILQENPNANVAKSERILSLATGAFILFQGLTNIFSHPVIALGEVAVGGTLLQRGITGYCPVKAMIEGKQDPVPVMISSPEQITVS